jgi:hypothetical protein
VVPTPEQILAGLTAIAHDWRSIAIAWHIAIGIALIAVAAGWRPTYRAAGILTALLPASVAAFAFSYGNPFNGVVLGATAVALAVLGAGALRVPIHSVPWWTRAFGIAMVAFGWVYPHFLDGNPIEYLYAAPLGLVPCPTLAMAIGLTFLIGGGGRRASRRTLAGVGVFYGVFGVVRLGVTIDIVLFIGAALLATPSAFRVQSRWAHRWA